MASRLRRQFWAGILRARWCGYGSRRSWTHPPIQRPCFLGSQRDSKRHPFPLIWISPWWEKAKLGCYCKVRSQTPRRQESLCSPRNGGGLGEQLRVWARTWKSNCWVLLAEKWALLGRLTVVLCLFMKHWLFSLCWGRTFPCGMKAEMMKGMCIPKQTWRISALDRRTKLAYWIYLLFTNV